MTQLLLPHRGVRRGLAPSDLTALAASVAADRRSWLPRVEVPGGDRWWTRLYGDHVVDLWLLTWLPGHTRSFHDHGFSAAAFTVVKGRLEEVQPSSGGPPVVWHRRKGTSAWVAPGTVHDVRAVSGRPAISIHAYSPPLRRMTYYEPDARGRLAPGRTVETTQPEQELAR